MVTIKTTRQSAESLIDLVVEAYKRGEAGNFQLDALEDLAYGCGMVKNEDQLDEWMKRIGVNGE